MKKLARRAVSFIFYAAIIVFLILYVKNLDFAALKEVEIDIFLMLISAFFGLLYRIWGAFTWLKILSLFGSAKSGAGLYYVYAKAWMGRYIPGKLPWILGKIYFASQFGISKTKLGISSLLEGALQILSALIIGSALLLVSGQMNMLSGEMKWVGLSVVLLMLLMLYPKIFNRGTSIAYRVIRKQNLEENNLVNGRILTTSFSLFAIGIIFSGISYFFLTKSLIPDLGYSYLPFIIGLFNVAGAIGMISFFAPSGIGVRDGIQLFFLNHTFTPELAFVIVVLARLWSFVIDILFFLVFYVAKLSANPISAKRGQAK